MRSTNKNKQNNNSYNFVNMNRCFTIVLKLNIFMCTTYFFISYYLTFVLSPIVFFLIIIQYPIRILTIPNSLQNNN